MGRPSLEVADVVRAHEGDFAVARGGRVSGAERRVLRHLVACRTAASGGHVQKCDQCGHQKIAYNSCRNRHCPKCQELARAKWIRERERELLPVEYFHVVFTIPQEIAAIALQNKAVVYKILFNSSASALREIARDPKHLGAEIGFLSVLHTWGSNLLHHPHIHCVVPGGGIALDGTQWTPCRPGFFLPVRVLGRLFRGKFLHELRQSFDRGDLGFHGRLVGLSDTATFRKYLRSAYAADWVVYAKPPFNGPKQVLRYLAGYTHRVAISNRRLLSMENGKVYFRWKDYRNGGRRRIMRLTATEFLRRFLLHILPKGFQRIRHYGFLANRRRGNAVERCRQLIDATQEMPTQPLPSASDTEVTILCAECGRGTMVCVLVVPAGMWARSAYEDSS